jgi:hypothetical protein
MRNFACSDPFAVRPEGSPRPPEGNPSRQGQTSPGPGECSRHNLREISDRSPLTARRLLEMVRDSGAQDVVDRRRGLN